MPTLQDCKLAGRRLFRILKKNAFRRRGAHISSDKTKMSPDPNDFARGARWKLRSLPDPWAILTEHAPPPCQRLLGRWPRPLCRTSSWKVVLFIVKIVISEHPSCKHEPSPRWLKLAPRPRGWNLFLREFPLQRISLQRGAQFSGAPIARC